MRKAPFLSSPPPKLGESQNLLSTWRKSLPAEELPREQDAQVTHSALFRPHALQTGSQITWGAGDWEDTAAPRLTPRVSPQHKWLQTGQS